MNIDELEESLEYGNIYSRKRTVGRRVITWDITYITILRKLLIQWKIKLLL
jgi:hypothetical protein